MAETLAQRETAMCKVLLDVQRQRPFEEFNREEQRLLLECYNAGYFEGVVILEMISGRIVMEYRHQPRLTYQGLEFLDQVERRSQEKQNGGKPDRPHTGEQNSDVSKQSLNWNRAGVIVAALAALLTILTTILVAIYF